MTRKTNMEAWITSAGTSTNPLIFQVSTGIYEVYAPLVAIPYAGNLYRGQRSGIASERAYSKGNRFKFAGVSTTIPTAKPTWDVTDPAILRSIASNITIEQVGISTYIEAVEAVEVVEAVEAVEAVEVVEVVEAVEAVEAVETPDFSTMTKRAVDSWASEIGIEVDGRQSKVDMIKFIEGELAKK